VIVFSSTEARVRLVEMFEHATNAGPSVLASLLNRLEFLRTYGYVERDVGRNVIEENVRLTLSHDFADLSLGFSISRRRITSDGTDAEWYDVIHGGLIYSGPGRPLDGSAPQLTVGLSNDSVEGWSVHT